MRSVPFAKAKDLGFQRVSELRRAFGFPKLKRGVNRTTDLEGLETRDGGEAYRF